MPKTFEPQSVIGGLWVELLALVPPKRMARAVELALGLHGQYAAGESTADRDGFSRGHAAGKSDAAEADQRGYADGWREGHAAALADAIGRIGVPAQRPHDGDELFEPPQPPPVA